MKVVLCKHDPLAVRTVAECSECAAEEAAAHYSDAWVIYHIQRLQENTNTLARQVKELEEFNASRRQPVQQTPADHKLEAAIGQAASSSLPQYLRKSDAGQLIRMRAFILDILNPEMYGHAVSREVYNAARRVLDIDSQE